MINIITDIQSDTLSNAQEKNLRDFEIIRSNSHRPEKIVDILWPGKHGNGKRFHIARNVRSPCNISLITFSTPFVYKYNIIYTRTSGPFCVPESANKMVCVLFEKLFSRIILLSFYIQCNAIRRCLRVGT